MAAARAGQSITRRVSENIEYTHKWTIEDFDYAMMVKMVGRHGTGKLESDRFCIPGVFGEFHLVIEIVYLVEIGHEMPKTVKVEDQQLDAKFYFSVSLRSTGKDLRAHGKLEVLKEGAETLFGNFGDPTIPKFVPSSVLASDFCFKSNGIEYQYRIGNFREARGFFTTGSTQLLSLVATITIAGKLVNLGGGAEEEMVDQERLLDFKPLLSDPKHSDIVLKCGDARFLCHKVILATG